MLKKLIKIFISEFKNIFLNDPTALCQFSIAPIILVGISLSNAIALSLAIFLVTTLTLMTVNIIYKKLKDKFATMICLIISALFYIPVSFLIKFLFPDNFESLGIYLPMVVINSVIISKSRNFTKDYKFYLIFFNSLIYITFFTFEIIIISVIREILGKGSIYGFILNLNVKFPALLMPFTGFIFIGLLAALLQAIYNKKFKNINLK